jgi:hypothetical protein
VIIILKREDLPPNHRGRHIESLELKQCGLSAEIIEKAELIVFVEGKAVKFLKHREDIQSKHSFDVLVSYITSIAPATKERMPFRVPQSRRHKKPE